MDKITRSVAVENTVEEIEQWLSSGFAETNAGEDWIKAWFGFDLKWSDEPPQYVTIPKGEVVPFVERARANAIVFNLAMFVAGKRLAAGVEGPPDLNELVSQYLIGEFTRKQKKIGRATNWGRDFIIIDSIYRLLEAYNISPTQNRIRLGVKDVEPSACQIVEEALTSTRLENLSLETIQRIWGNKTKQAQYYEALELHRVSLFDDVPELERI